MPYDPIQGQGHGGPRCGKMADFKGCLHQYARYHKTNSELWYSQDNLSKF